MKIATRKITLYILSFVFAICLGAFAFVSMGNTKTVNADDPTEKNVTFTGLDSTWNNYAYSSGGYTKYSFLKFSGGISSGSHVAGNMDFSDLIANTTYTGSSNTWNLYPSSLIWGVDKENNNSIIFRTASNPQGGDTLRINAGAWFITGGNINEKYVITSDIVLWFNGTAWVVPSPFTINGAFSDDNTWNGCYGSLGAYLDDWGIEKEASSIGYWRPKTGTIIMTGPSSNVLASDKVDITANVTGIKYNGTELKEISGAVISQAFKNLVIYVPDVTDGVVTIDKYTMVGSKYAADDYAFVLSAKAAPNSDVIEWSVAHKITFDSNGGTAVDPIYVATGTTGEAPTAPTKASVGNTSYTFDCWLDDGDNEYNFSTAVTGNITLTASWTEITTVNVTLNTLDGTENNFSSGDFYYTRLKFNVGISTGVSGQQDFSNFIANTTYSGSSVAYSWVPGSTLGWPANTKSDNVFNFIYLMTTTAPTAGDCITVKASAWFTTGGTIEERYVLASDFGITFDGTGWTILPKFTIFDSRDETIITQIIETKDGPDFVYTLPSDLSYVGYKVFGFAVTDGGARYFYPAGGVHKSSNNNLAFVAVIGTFNIVNGASIRITTAETSGIRWQATVDKVTKDNVLYWGETGTTFGMEISAEGFTANFDIKTKYWANDTTYNAVLSDVNSDYYTTEFTAKAYVDVVYSNGTTSRIYADNTGVTRSIAYVAGATLDDPNAEWSDRQAAILTAIAGR